MSQRTESSDQIKNVVAGAIELLSEEKQHQLLLSVSAMIKEQRRETAEGAQHQDPGLSEEAAVSTCGFSDEALAEQERILEEVIAKHHIQKVTKQDLEMHQS